MKRRPSNVPNPLTPVLFGFIGVVLGAALVTTVLYWVGYAIVLVVPCGGTFKQGF